MPLGSTLMGELREGFQLPITRRGLFSEDDFFKGFQHDYSQAVGDVLDRWRSRSSLADRYASYRKLRERDHSDDSQAATVSETPTNHVIVVDMSDYANGQITVETQGFSAVVNGQAGQRVYHRRFPLPQDTVIDGVVADLSDDNILTVTAPRKGKGVAINLGSDSPTVTPTVSASTQQQSTSVRSAEERVIPTVKEGGAAASTSATHAIRTHQQQQSSSDRRGSTSRIIPLSIEDEATTPEAMGGGATTTTTEQTSSTTTERVIPTIKQAADTRSSTFSQFANATTTQLHNRVLPIKKRGRFFQDATFEKVWRDFESAMDDKVAKEGSKVEGKDEGDDRYQTYRNLRDVIQQDDNQAGTVTKESDEFKIVLDVKDFADAHLDVKALAGSIVVTGEKGKRSFERRFSIPGLSKPEMVAAALSADGVLTITAPV
ncbi:hypothetical protein Pmani_008596 [Petrolisthes manimaculis]|uniref:SHSP domain-containing protein n=1 Tax=Petrolisthes manimaculis TaxID=1843537 RepID=A0AAE1Q8L2_9EUCA|nr:hypothetical protein Pmani_008596 [Petrolisthes manimaculis]